MPLLGHRLRCPLPLPCVRVMIPLDRRPGEQSPAPGGTSELRPPFAAATCRGRTDYGIGNGAHGTRTPCRPPTSKPGAPITTGLASAMAITPKGKTLYLADDNIVITVNTATNKPGRPIPLPICAGSIAITPNGPTPYALPTRRTGAPAVRPISTPTSRVGRPLTTNRAPTAPAITPDGSTRYV